VKLLIVNVQNPYLMKMMMKMMKIMKMKMIKRMFMKQKRK